MSRRPSEPAPAPGARPRIRGAAPRTPSTRRRKSAPRHATSMTPLPRHLPGKGAAMWNKPLKSLARSTVARFVLHLGALVSLPLCACAVPPSLQLDQPDAGENAAPIITSVSDGAAKELVEPGPVNLVRGRGTLSITLRDADIADVLNVRLYVDYNSPDPTPPRATCRASASTTVSRSTVCDISGVCTMADVGQTRLLWIEVFDREVLESGMPRFRAMAAGGASSKWQYSMQCQEPQ